ncbi:MAG TPA: M23 family metallopeptidase [Polyangia bacterium]|nr:M23 family metallopeptidase [Polyangia bacterium]
MRNSVRLGVLLAGLVGVNVYVFFFNHKTAPRDVLNLQSTSKSMDAQKRDVLKKDSEAAKRALVPVPGAPKLAAATGRAPKPSNNQAAAPIEIPFAPKPIVQIPFAPPEDDADEEVDEGGAGPVEKKIGVSDTLTQVLTREGFGAATGAVIAALSKLCDPKLIRGGQGYLVRFDDQGVPESFEYHPSAVLRFIVEKEDDGSATGLWKARKVEQPLAIKTIEAAGVIESSLYESIQRAGEPTALVGLLVELFAWDVNFYIDTHPGDRWKVVVEKQYLGGQFYKFGRLLAAEYSGRVGTFRAFYWKGKSGNLPGKYYDDHGQAIAKTMLKTPLRFVRISSKFDRNRFHPILHRTKAHLGVDYAAPTGTPVWASASGRVVEAQMKHGSGNTVVIAHANGLNTRYYHLARFARGLRAGQSVRQKDVIGYVGTTGLSTGPHLHFSVTKNGGFVDPTKLQVTRDPAVPDRTAFFEAIRPRIAMLKSMQPALAKN